MYFIVTMTIGREGDVEGDGGQFCIACSVTQMKILGVLKDLRSQSLGPEMSTGP